MKIEIPLAEKRDGLYSDVALRYQESEHVVHNRRLNSEELNRLNAVIDDNAKLEEVWEQLALEFTEEIERRTNKVSIAVKEEKADITIESLTNGK